MTVFVTMVSCITKFLEYNLPILSFYNKATPLMEAQIINVLVLFPNFMDPKGLDGVLSTMIPALQQADGLRSLTISEGHVMSPGGPQPYSKIVAASFESLGKFMTWVQTPGAQANKELMVNSGVIRLYYEVKDL